MREGKNLHILPEYFGSHTRSPTRTLCSQVPDLQADFGAHTFAGGVRKCAEGQKRQSSPDGGRGRAKTTTFIGKTFQNSRKLLILGDICDFSSLGRWKGPQVASKPRFRAPRGQKLPVGTLHRGPPKRKLPVGSWIFAQSSHLGLGETSRVPHWFHSSSKQVPVGFQLSIKP